MVGVCHNFKKTGTCRFGDNCKFQHVSGGKRKIPKTTCPKFASKEGCRGECKLAHAFEEDSELLAMFERGINIVNIRVQEIGKLQDQVALQDMYDLPEELTAAAAAGPTTSFTLDCTTRTSTVPPALRESLPEPSSSSSSAEQQANLAGARVVTTQLTGDEYTREVQQVSRLYRGRCQLHETDTGTLIQLHHKPTDPDWNLTLEEVSLDLFIPISYPTVQPSLEFSDDRVSERTEEAVNTAIREEIVLREGSLSVRPLLRWVDRNIGEMLQVESQLRTALSLTVHRHGADESSESDDDEGEEGEGAGPDPAASTDYLNGELGTSIRLVDLDLHTTVDGLTVRSLLVLLQCLRCKEQSEATLVPGSLHVSGCSRCSSERSSKLHRKLCTGAPGASSLACVEMVGCSVADALLARSAISAICAHCSATTHASLAPGTTSTAFCSSCGHKLSISLERARLVVITPPGAPSGKQRSRARADKGYVEGQPLPDSGVCKHYRRSQRWFRFACCGRLFPCDKCHDATLPDCPTEFGGRMVCGFCAREQPTRQQCRFCHGEVAGGVRSSHWEGGKGCRDVVRMSHNDSRKFKNRNKTVCQKDKRTGKQKTES